MRTLGTAQARVLLASSLGGRAVVDIAAASGLTPSNARSACLGLVERGLLAECEPVNLLTGVGRRDLAAFRLTSGLHTDDALELAWDMRQEFPS